MDFLPQIPTTKEVNDTISEIRSAFRENFEAEIFSIDIAKNIEKYDVDDDLSLKETAKNVVEINTNFAADLENITETEHEIIKDHEEYLFSKQSIMKNEFLREISKLKSCDIFTNINSDDAIRYGLIQKCDLYPDVTRQFLDFRFNTTLHRCKQCFGAINKQEIFRKENKSAVNRAKKVKKETPLPQEKTFTVKPEEVVFVNYETNNVYEQTVKIINASPHLQIVRIHALPKLPIFNLIYESQKIASGMTVKAKIIFEPQDYLNLEDEVSFIGSNGKIITLPLKCKRSSPMLFGYIYKSTDPSFVMDQHIPGSRNYSTKRQYAVNDTIDCGTCLTTEYILIHIFFVNTGNNAKFFWLTEEDFYSENIHNLSTTMELSKEGFWIYPTYFEMLNGDISEISIIFQPLKCGLHTQTLYLMCDNNTFREIQIIGDSICFNKNIVSVHIPFLATYLEKKEDHCIFLGHLKRNEISRFSLSIKNRSSIFLKYYFKFESKVDTFDMSKWIKVRNAPIALAPYSITEVIFEIEPDSNLDTGYYNTSLKLFIKDIPIASLEEDDSFIVVTNNTPLEHVVENMSVVDVLIMDVEVAGYIEPEIKLEEINDNVNKCEKCNKIRCPCKDCMETVPRAILVFSTPLLDLGVLPVGVNIKKDFYIMNLAHHESTWKIAEIKYNLTTHPYVEVVGENNVSLDYGILMSGEKQELSYNIVKRDPARWVSILILFLVTKNVEDETIKSDVIAQSICVLTYEITKLDIVVKTSHTDGPILCPLEMLYTGVPINLTFKLQNFSLITGCFYFLKPIGKDAEKVEVAFHPQCGELKPHSSKKIRVQLTCLDVGILENIFLPCFIGKGQEPLLVRLLCVVDCIHVFFYLPSKEKEYQRVLWPPKVLYEYDRTWSQYCMCEDMSYEYENTIQNIQSDNASLLLEQSGKTLNEIKSSHSNLNKKSEEASEDTGKSSQNLIEMVENADSEVFLQDCIMQVGNVLAKQPRKITIYFENVTPKSAKYTIQSTNFPAKENLIDEALTISYKTTEELWELMIDKYGIFVNPQIESGILHSHELVSADIWIYANTWGIYIEEIIVDIEDIACFTFSMIIEVVGCPLQLPFSIGAITKYPTIRFGSVSFGAENITKDIVILNNSSIDVKISWHMFNFSNDSVTENLPPFNFICDVVQRSEEKFEFDFTKRFFGNESSECIEVLPRTFDLSSTCKTAISVTFQPSALSCNDQKCTIQCFILGRIFMAEVDRFKSGYFYRNNNSLIIEATGAIERPYLDINIEEEKNTLHIYANEVALNREAEFYIELLARNSTLSTIEAHLDCSDPFSLKNEDKKIIVGPGKCEKIRLQCLLSYEKITRWSTHVYQTTEIKEYHQPRLAADREPNESDEVKLAASTDKLVNDDNKIFKLSRKLFLYYKGGIRDIIPLHVSIYYPNIAVKPIHVKFGYLLVGRTEKTYISVFNLTGYRILFEVFKSLPGQEIVVIPPCGEIEKSTGINHSFVDIAIYFTPIECRNYQESIRIMTNIPQYYIDIPIKGAGSFNEKFDSGSK